MKNHRFFGQILQVSAWRQIPEKYSEALIGVTLIFLIYSYNYHFLWIFYDVVSVFGAILLTQKRKDKQERYIVFIIMPALIFGVLQVIITGHFFKGLLSVWDTLKHMFMLYLVFYALHNKSNLNSNYGSEGILISKILLSSLAIQFLVVSYQFCRRFPIDNVAGTFGDGATHPLGYLSFACLAIVIFRKHNWMMLAYVFLVSFFINVLAENIGFFILLSLLLIGKVTLFNQNTLKVSLIYLSIFALIGTMLCFIPYGVIMHNGNNESVSTVILSRGLNAISPPKKPVTLKSNPHNRSDYTNLAWQYGGFFGYGIGAFSDIYHTKGYKSNIMEGLQINISELTHLLAEWGVIGVILVASFYCLFFASYFVSWKGKIFASAIFLSAFMYSTVLMTEPQILFLGITLAVISVYEKINYTRDSDMDFDKH